MGTGHGAEGQRGRGDGGDTGTRRGRGVEGLYKDSYPLPFLPVTRYPLPFLPVTRYPLPNPQSRMGLDAVELIVGWEKAFGVEISDREAESLLTPKMAMELFAHKLSASTSTGICPTLRSYYAVRQTFQAVLGLQCQQVRLDSELKLLLPKRGYLEAWREIQYFIGAPEFPQFNFGLGTIFRPIEVRDLVNWFAAFYPCLFLNYNECCTYFQIRSVVRAVIREIVKENDFPDELDFRMLIG